MDLKIALPFIPDVIEKPLYNLFKQIKSVLHSSDSHQSDFKISVIFSGNKTVSSPAEMDLTGGSLTNPHSTIFVYFDSQYINLETLIKIVDVIQTWLTIDKYPNHDIVCVPSIIFPT